MKKEYDFSKAEQGKFYRPGRTLEIPVYLDREVEEFFAEKAAKGRKPLNRIVNTILRKEMDILKSVGPRG